MKDVYSIKYSVGDLIYSTSTKEFAIITEIGIRKYYDEDLIKAYWTQEGYYRMHFLIDICEAIERRAYEHYPVGNQ
jgi:hypothetical protein